MLQAVTVVVDVAAGQAAAVKVYAQCFVYFMPRIEQWKHKNEASYCCKLLPLLLALQKTFDSRQSILTAVMQNFAFKPKSFTWSK